MRKWIWVLITVLMLSGCGGKGEDKTAVVFRDAAAFPTETVEEFPLLDLGEGSAAVRSYEELYTEFGKFYFAQGSGEDKGDYVLTLSDYEAGESYPLCARTNCLHDTEDCAAFFPFSGGKPNFLYYDGAYLYFYHRGDGLLYRQRADGSDRSVVADLSGEVSEVNAILYEENIAWLLCERWTSDSDKTAYTVRKIIVSLDLETGEWTELPFDFQEDMTNVELYGKYGDELLLHWSYSAGLIPWQDPEETRHVVFLLHVETGEVTTVAEYEFTYVSSAKCPGYLIYCLFDPDSEYEVSYRGGEWSAFSGEVQIFDLTERVCYRMESSCLTWEFSIRDGKLFYCELGEDGVTLEGRIRDLETGEVTDWLFFDESPQLLWLEETEEHFIVISGDRISRITKADYYAGNRNLIPIP